MRLQASSDLIVIGGLARSGLKVSRRWFAGSLAQRNAQVCYFNVMRCQLYPNFEMPTSKKTLGVLNGEGEGTGYVLVYENLYMKRPELNYADVFDAFRVENLRLQGYVYIVRDPYNQFASRLSMMASFRDAYASRAYGDDYKTFRYMWLRHMREIPSSCILLEVSRIARDPTARRNFLSYYGLPTYSDEEVWNTNQNVGTRFKDGTMDERYKVYLDDPRFKPLLEDDEVREVAARAFGWYLCSDGERRSCE